MDGLAFINDQAAKLNNVILEENDVLLKITGATISKPIKDQANESAKKAEVAINKKFGDLSKTIQEVAKDIESINSKVHFDVKEKISDIMVTKTFSDGPIHLENQGEGLKRQIWFSLIKAKSDDSVESNNKFIWAFDEPETHLYPGAQREFFDILNKISLGNVQTLISTHSTIFIDKSNLNKINSVKQEANGYTEINKCEDIEAIYSSLNVKNSDFLFHDKFLIVEGDTEQYLIPKLYEIYTSSTLIKDNIQLVNIQGKDKWDMNKAIIDKVVTGFKKTDQYVVYLFDNDMRYKIGEAAILNNMFFVGDQDIEDAIDNSIWVEILNEFYKDSLIFKLEEIEGFKNEVVKGVEGNSNQKFYSILKNKIRNKFIGLGLDPLIQLPLPSKGSESADFLLSSIVNIDNIPLVIRNAFDELRK